MRIFFITSKLNFRTAGGSIEEFDLMIRTLQELGNEVTTLTVFPSGNKIPLPLPYKVVEEKIQASGLLGIQWGIFKLLKKYEAQADIFHLDGHLFLYGAGLYRHLGGKVPVSAFFNRELSSWPENKSFFFRTPSDGLLLILKKRLRFYIEKCIGMPLANGLDLCSFISPMFQIEYEKFGLNTKGKSLVIGDPIDLKKISEKNSITEESYIKRNKKNSPLIIFYSSRMASGKGFDVLLTAFSKVKNKEDFHLILGGAGPEEKMVKKMIADFGLRKYVELPGWVDKTQLFAYHKQADIFIQADWMIYGTSISLLYAMAFGLPCILPGGGGLEWVASDCALYFKNRDTDDLARKIEQLGGDYSLRAQLSHNCFLRLANENFNYENQIGKLYNGMRKVAGKK